MNKRQLIARLADTTKDGAFLEIGDALARLRTQLYPEDFAKAIERADISYRKARYLIVAFEKYKALSINRRDAIELGWTKLATIAPILTQDNAPYWIARAKELTVTELNAEIHRSQGNQVGSVSVSFKMTDEQVRRLHEALVRAGATENGRGLLNKAAALDRVITKWLGD